MKAAGLVDTLQGPGPFTVFAPTNEAFAQLPKGAVENLLKPENKDQLVKIARGVQRRMGKPEPQDVPVLGAIDPSQWR